MLKSLAWIAATGAFIGVGSIGAVAVTHQASNPSEVSAAKMLMAGNNPAKPSEAWHDHGPGMIGFGNLITDAAKALNLSPGTVQADLKAGQSLATIAANHGSSASALEATLVQDATTQIQSAVAAGKLSATQASQLETHLSTMIDRMVTDTRPMYPGWGHPGNA